jgi:hypothetical protein
MCWDVPCGREKSLAEASEINMFVRAADCDWQTVQLLVVLPHSADVVIGFHAQQMVEKLLKALLVSRDQIYPLTHDLEV